MGNLSYKELIMIICLFSACSGQAADDTNKKDIGTDPNPLGYISPNIPDFQVPVYTGVRYEAMVPDTLDLAERAKLAIHGLTENTNPDRDYDLFTNVYWLPYPEMQCGGLSASDVTVKLREAVALARIMCGSKQNIHIDKAWMEVELKEQGPDGLIYIGTKGRPATATTGLNTVSGGSAESAKRGDPQVLAPLMNGQILRNMVIYAERDKSGFWDERIRKLIDGMSDWVVDTGEYAYFWPGSQLADRHHPADAKPVFDFGAPELSGSSLGLILAYRKTGYKPALTLARKLINFQRDCFYTPEGAWLTPQKDAIKAHTLPAARFLMVAADYGIITKDAELLDFVVKCYEWGRERANKETGFYPNLVPCPSWRMPSTIEGTMGNTHAPLSDKGDYNGCCLAGLAGMIAVALKLSEAGVADYWDDVDRWVRNMIAGSQMLTTEWPYYLPGSKGGESLRVYEPAKTEKKVIICTNDRVAERNLGGWPTYASPNDWCEQDGRGIYGFLACDTAWTTRSIYGVWNRIVTHKDGKLKVNLLLNRASRWADVDSYIPYQGRVDIKIKKPLDLSVRIAEWVKPKDVNIQVNGTDRKVSFDGRYVLVGKVKPSDIVKVTFPIEERTDVVDIWMGLNDKKVRYSLVRRGNEVVEIFPRGKYYPFYSQRGHYRTGQPRWRKVERFVSDEQIESF